MTIELTELQKDFIKNANRTWNWKVGAVRSGKTYIDYLYRIPKKTRELSGKEGSYVIMGVSQASVERNVLEPMRNLYGRDMVGIIKGSQGTVDLFGETYHVVGHEKKNAVGRIQGSSIKYAYVDEAVLMHQSVFEMLKSRLEKPYAQADLTGNPERPTHYLKQFIDEEKEHIYYQHYTIDDNPMLSPEFVTRLKREYEGTVYYKRFILGQWAIAEGAIYHMFNTSHIVPNNYLSDKEEKGKKTKAQGYVNIGIDFGGNQSAHAFNATWIANDDSEIVTVMDKRIGKKLTPAQLDDAFIEFMQDMLDEKWLINDIRADNAEPVLIRGIQQALDTAGIYYRVRNARKGPINDRIRTYQRLLNTDRYKIYERCKDTIGAFENAVWSDKPDSDGKDVRLDDGTTNIDNLDAQEYSTEKVHKQLLRE